MHGLTNDTNRKILLYLGATMIAVGCLMTFMFGLSMSPLHAVGLAGLTIAAGVMWGPIDEIDGNGWRKMAGFLRVVGVFFIVAELFSHLGYTVGNRIQDVEQTGVQNASYTSVQKSIAEDEGALVAARKERDDLKEANPWVGTVSADALRAQIPAMDEAVRQEERRGGCGPKCLALKEKKAAVEAKIATAENGNGVAIRIAALEKRLEGRRSKGEATEFKSSFVLNQTKFVSQLATLSLEPSKAALTWGQIGIAFVLALVTTFLGPVCWRLATMDKPRIRSTETNGRPEAQPAPTQSRVAIRGDSFMDKYRRHCRTQGVAPVAA